MAESVPFWNGAPVGAVLGRLFRRLGDSALWVLEMDEGRDDDDESGKMLADRLSVSEEIGDSGFCAFEEDDGKDARDAALEGALLNESWTGFGESELGVLRIDDDEGGRDGSTLDEASDCCPDAVADGKISPEISVLLVEAPPTVLAGAPNDDELGGAGSDSLDEVSDDAVESGADGAVVVTLPTLAGVPAATLLPLPVNHMPVPEPDTPLGGKTPLLPVKDMLIPELNAPLGGNAPLTASVKAVPR